MSDDSITIGITTYNAEQSIADALESVLAQDVPVRQIIVVDDASTDRTVKIVEKYRAQNPTIEIVQHEKNQGVAAARNTIIEHARCTFLAFFDDDDISAPGRVRAQRSRIVTYECDFAAGALVISHTARRQIYPDGTERIEPAMGSTLGLAPNGREVIDFTLMGRPLPRGGYGSCATCSQMTRVTTYRALGGFDPAFRRGGDTELAIRLARMDGHLIGHSEPLVVQHMTPSAEKSLDKLLGFWIEIFTKHRDLFETEVLFQFCRRWIELKFLWLEGNHLAFSKALTALMLSHPILTFQRCYRASRGLRQNWIFSRFSRSIHG